MATDFASKIYNLKLELQPASIIEYTSEVSDSLCSGDVKMRTKISTQSFTSLQKELLDATIAHARLPSENHSKYSIHFFVLSVMLGASEVHEMGKSMITLTRTKKVLDIGTFTGASALAWAIELPIDGKVISMDVDHTQLEKV